MYTDIKKFKFQILTEESNFTTYSEPIEIYGMSEVLNCLFDPTEANTIDAMEVDDILITNDGLRWTRYQ